MTITAIEPQKGDPNRRNIFADGKFVLGVSARVLDSFDIREGMEISREQLYELAYSEDVYKAKRRALGYLDYGDHSEKTMLDKLIRVGHPEDAARDAIDELCEDGIIDDESYANRYAYYLYTKKLYGRRRVVTELIAKGVDRDTASIAADEQMPDDFAPAIQKLAEKRARSVRGAAGKDYDKVFAYLLRCGHEYGDIREVLDEIF